LFFTKKGNIEMTKRGNVRVMLCFFSSNHIWTGSKRLLGYQ